MNAEPHSARLLPSVVQPPTVVFNSAGAPAPDGLRGMGCPNCGSGDAKALLLTVDVQLPDNPAKRLCVLRCPACTASFYDSQVPPDYAEPALNDRGRVPFYVEQGAGVSLITRPLAQLRRGPGTSYMEVGCGYGFGLDFALNTCGWTGFGIDPAPLATLGRDALRLPIELRYLRDDEACGTVDVVMGSEVIEHVTSPSAFVRTLRAMLKPGGVLILTTPNGDDIDPAAPPGILVPLLSPSLHLVIQNRHSLGTLLEQGGFTYVQVDIDSHSLVAFASDAPLDLEQDHATLRRVLRSHLERRAETQDPSTDLFLAFAGRALFESVNDGDMGGADRAWALLVPACRCRFNLMLDGMTALPSELATCSLERMAELVPLNLGGMLYARSIRRLAGGTPRPVLEGQFLLAAAAAGAMRRALGELAMEDGQTEDIGWTADAEALLCAADAGDPTLVRRLAALPPAPNGGEARHRSIALRAMTNLVNAGRLDEARALVGAFRLDEEAFVNSAGPLTVVQRDALFCMSVLDVQIGPGGSAMGDARLACGRLRRVRAAAEPESGLWWAALRGEAQALNLLGDTASVAILAEHVERDHPGPDTAQWVFTTLVNAGHYAMARTVADRHGLPAAPYAQPAATRPLTDAERDTVFCLAVLNLQPGPGRWSSAEPAMARGRFARVRRTCEPGAGLWLAALHGELQALDMLDARDDAATLTGDVHAAHPEISLPGDILVRIGKG